MRVIAGSASGLNLKEPPQGVRPTMDRVKAAVFSSLGDRVPLAKVLDLFSGSGAMGVEALSRGATSAEFVDFSRKSIECIHRNLRYTKLEGKVHEMDAFKFLQLYAGKQTYDIIFADPPYDKGQDAPSFAVRLLEEKCLAECLTPEGIFVLEKNARVSCEIPSHWEELQRKRYGDTEILYLSCRE